MPLLEASASVTPLPVLPAPAYEPRVQRFLAVTTGDIASLRWTVFLEIDVAIRQVPLPVLRGVMRLLRLLIGHGPTLVWLCLAAARFGGLTTPSTNANRAGRSPGRSPGLRPKIDRFPREGSTRRPRQSTTRTGETAPRSAKCK